MSTPRRTTVIFRLFRGLTASLHNWAIAAALLGLVALSAVVAFVELHA